MTTLESTSSGGRVRDALSGRPKVAIFTGADLAGDTAFYQKALAEDWTRGDSDGTFYSKAEVMKLMADTKDFKTNSEKLSELKVRVYGNTAVATYKDTYDILFKGEHRAHTIIVTDTPSSRWAANGSRWGVTARQWRSSRLL